MFKTGDKVEIISYNSNNISYKGEVVGSTGVIIGKPLKGEPDDEFDYVVKFLNPIPKMWNIYPPDEQTELFYTSELKLLQSVRSLKDYM